MSRHAIVLGVLLAMVPSALLVGVTQHIAADVVSAGADAVAVISSSSSLVTNRTSVVRSCWLGPGNTW
jgi:thiamine monophosphate synthase